MEIKYGRSFFTRISEYRIQVGMTIKGRYVVMIDRFTGDKENGNPSESLNINPDILLDLIEALEECRDTIGIKPRPAEGKFELDKKREIQNRYLRGVSLKDLCVQFNTKTENIEKILMEADIELVTPRDSMPYKFYRNFRKSRFPK